MDQLIGAEVGGCLLRRSLGAGAIGSVYEGVHVASGDSVAVKLLSPRINAMPAVVDRFVREARLCYQIVHPHVVRVHTWGAYDDGRHYFVMEYVDGTTLLELLRTHRQGLDWPLACAIAADIGEALAHVHELEVVHRDIKPGNVLIDRRGRGKLADLGLARQLVGALDESGGRRLTAKGAALGSPAYMAPEQISDTSAVGPAADVYALGATLYHALCGRPPLIGENPTATLMRVMREDPSPIGALIAGLPAAVAESVDASLAKNPARRPADVGELARCLRAASAAAARD